MQIMLTFLGLIVLFVGTCMLVNSTFLEDYYVRNKVDALKNSYSVINDALNNNEEDSEELTMLVQRLSDTYNINMVVMDENMGTVITSKNDTDFLQRQLFSNLFGKAGLTGDEKRLEDNDKYVLQIRSDVMTGDKYIEMWGVMDDGSIFIMRSAMESITDSVAISNRFLIYIGIVVGIVSILISIWASRLISKPIKELTGISERMKELDFDAKYEGSSHNEIGVLGENINELSETLQTTISELKTANNELERDIAHKTQIDDMRKEFLSNVSHELKTPIALIQGYAEGLKDCVNDDDESREYYCDVIVDESAKMNNIVQKLLTLNQLEFGQDSANLERFNITEVIKGYIQSADILIKQHEATVHMEDYKPIEVWGDEFKAEEVFNNYFSNALNHLGGERKIDISIRRINDKVRVSVFNTGDPIPEESLEHIWEKFYKVDKARTREYGGSGVGLSIVKAIQDSLNQKYGVINYNNGVEFYFELDAR
ncbi:MAG: HAMP domain-containing histidine kinase [Lachnospiraceae bacterium]|nr:HAMP domain-containing histidine kinase [Lachnospiraceae bacterium]